MQELPNFNSWLWEGQRLRKREELHKSRRWKRERDGKGQVERGVTGLVRARLNTHSCHQLGSNWACCCVGKIEVRSLASLILNGS